MKLAGRLLVSLLCLSALSCAHAPGAVRSRPASRFVVPTDSLGTRYASVAIVPVRTEASFVMPVLEAPLDARIASAWAQAGYQVVGEGDGERLWFSAVRKIGGLFDPRTGKVIPARREEAWRRLLAAYRNVHAADLVLRYEVPETVALLEHGFIAWDDTEVRVANSNFYTRFTLEEWGETRATSLSVTLLDTDGRVLFTGRTGIRPMLALRAGPWAVLSQAESLADTAACSAAISRALGPWLQRVPPATAARAE